MAASVAESGGIDGQAGRQGGDRDGRGTRPGSCLCESGSPAWVQVAVADLNLRSYEEFEAEAKDMTGDSTVAEIEAMGGTALGIEVDVTDHEAVNAMVARVVAEWGRVDVLVANAGGGPSGYQATPRSGALAADRTMWSPGIKP